MGNDAIWTKIHKIDISKSMNVVYMIAKNIEVYKDYMVGKSKQK